MHLISHDSHVPMANVIRRLHLAQNHFEEVQQGTGNRGRYYDEDIPWALQVINELVAKYETESTKARRAEKDFARSKMNVTLLLAEHQRDLSSVWARIKFVLRYVPLSKRVQK